VSDNILAWWFCRPEPDGRILLPHGDGREVKVGETLTVEPPVILCERGLHASVRAIDALEYAPGNTLCRVRLSGQIVAPANENKLAATERTVLWRADASKLMHVFACWCAAEALRCEEKAGREVDVRSWDAIGTKIAWLDGEATDADLAAARDAARAAAWAAAWAAARDAARDAARAAARDAAWAAAWAAARAAARAAAWAAARAAAWAAARDAQAKQFEEMCLSLAPEVYP
jgi:hypothetical protein